jgi:hypothetical protein
MSVGEAVELRECSVASAFGSVREARPKRTMWRLSQRPVRQTALRPEPMRCSLARDFGKARLADSAGARQDDQAKRRIQKQSGEMLQILLSPHERGQFTSAPVGTG